MAFSNSEAQYIIHKLDRERRKKIHYDDLIHGWLYTKRQKSLVDKRKEAIKLKEEHEEQARKNKKKTTKKGEGE